MYLIVVRDLAAAIDVYLRETAVFGCKWNAGLFPL